MAAFGQTLLACHASLYRYARALSHDPSAAEELVQETYKRALAARRHPEIETPDHVRPWAFIILRNIWRNSLRDQRPTADGEPDEDGFRAPAEDSPEEILVRKLLRSEIVQAIDGLPPTLREVVVLRDIEGLSYAEIALVLQCPAGTVMSRLARARQVLRKVLASLSPSPSPSSSEVER
ncbi:MAG: sigma-70 family RNA polymerase sigma factor [Acidobacteria bacterium]|nr:sigma-70 family RNA polymerase sigma factor [Acidobacteriota bacterium]